jgi:uncharacterized LabA/DUF88 family protein/cold shock CspA family protein
MEAQFAAASCFKIKIMSNKQSLLKIGIIYDGNYFYHVSNYYNYDHRRKSRISVAGLHEFIKHQVAHEEHTDEKYCRIVDAHYFRGRLSAYEAAQKGETLYYERVFDDILMSENITTHYLPVTYVQGRREEKGIDVWLALEAFELCMYKEFDILVLIAGDGDYTPLVRKINALGTRVMVLGWEFEYTASNGMRFVTRTSSDLKHECTYSIAMQQIMDDPDLQGETLIENLFVRKESIPIEVPEDADEDELFGEILSIKAGYGFIRFPPNNVFFHFSSLKNVEFNNLREGDKVGFKSGLNEKGENIASTVRLV